MICYCYQRADKVFPLLQEFIARNNITIKHREHCSLSMTFVVVSTARLLLLQFDHVINTQDGDGSFSSEFQALHFADQRFEYSGLLVVQNFAILQIQARPFQMWHSLVLLTFVVESTQFSHQLTRILRSISRQCFRDDQQRIRKLGNRQLLATGLKVSIILNSRY